MELLQPLWQIGAVDIGWNVCIKVKVVENERGPSQIMSYTQVRNASFKGRLEKVCHCKEYEERKESIRSTKLQHNVYKV